MKKFLGSAILTLLCAAPSFAAPTVTFQRVTHSNTAPLVIEIVTATASGTYATGGFSWTPTAIAGTFGTSPLPYAKVRAVNWFSPNGYIYATTFATVNGVVQATTKIYSAPGTELANGTAMPDASLPVLIYLGL